MLNLIQVIWTLFGRVRSEVLGAILRALLSLGLPPTWREKDELRAWLRKLMLLLHDLASLTPTPIDDQLLKLLAAATNSDDAWDAFYTLLLSAIDGQLVVASDPSHDDMLVLHEVSGLDPLTILSLLKLLGDLLKLLRK